MEVQLDSCTVRTTTKESRRSKHPQFIIERGELLWRTSVLQKGAKDVLQSGPLSLNVTRADHRIVCYREGALRSRTSPSETIASRVAIKKARS
jgi:hypothetical protein